MTSPPRHAAASLAAAALLGWPLLAAAAPVCLPYEPAVVSIVGKLERRTFPGPPNFESVAGGDRAETGFYLRPRTPLCAIGSAGSANPDTFRHVGLVQLLLDRAGYDRLRPQLGRIVRLRGQLSGQVTGHHHARLLLQIEPPGS